jgi:predicted nucleic acid-binding protein
MRVVDSSVVIKWHIDEVDSEAAQTLRHGSERFAIPDLLFVETANIV